MRFAPLALILLLPATSPALPRPDVTRAGPFKVGFTTITFTKPAETTGQPRRLARFAPPGAKAVAAHPGR